MAEELLLGYGSACTMEVEYHRCRDGRVVSYGDVYFEVAVDL
jgi:hypothetical protein